MAKMRNICDGKKSQRGNVIVEFALGWSLIWLLFSGLYHYGYSFYVYNMLQTSVANAAQLASQLNYDTSATETFTSQIQSMSLYGDPSATSGTPLVPGLSGSNIAVTITLSNSVPTDVTVDIVNFSFSTIFNTVTLNGKPRVTVAYRGQVTCSTC